MNNEICLVGNPNCGKTTLFNALTGTYQKVGNWAGVTTEKKEGRLKTDKNIKIIDLPGLYSLNAKSTDEREVLNYLNKTSPKVIINVLDGTNLERNLYLTCQLTSLNVPIVLAVNFSDELKKSGAKLDAVALSNLFNVPVVEISALKNKNLDKLIEVSKKAYKKPKIINEVVNEFISKNISNIIVEIATKKHVITDKIDNVILNKYLAIPIFCLILTFIYFLSIKLGGILGKNVEKIFSNLAINTKISLTKVNAPEWLTSLTCDAILGGFTNVICFLPQILILFFLLTILEESGYAARISFILDGLLNKLGLGGKSFIPLMVSCGCIVPGLMATRTIESESEKLTTVYVSPFMPCGAKMAVFGWFSQKFFNGNPLIATSLYFLSVAVALISGAILQKLKFFGKNEKPFLLEIPPLRAPSLKNVAYVLWEKTKDFLIKAGTVVFGVCVLLWMLKNFGINGYTNGKVEGSFLFYIGNVVKYLFYPLGFCSWQTAVSVLSGILAKEAVVESLQFVSSDYLSLFSNGFSIYSFLVFILFSPPCMASLVTAKKELKSKKLFIFMILFQFVTAYMTSMLINLVGKIVCGDIRLIFVILLGIIFVGFFTTVKLKFNSCGKCENCKGNCKKSSYE